MHVSITGLRLRRWWHAPRFWWLAIAAMRQAQSAPGCLEVKARSIDGVHHTVSLWDSEASMRAYITDGAHRRAMRNFRQIATGGTFGYTADALPDWDEARRIWEAQAKAY